MDGGMGDGGMRMEGHGGTEWDARPASYGLRGLRSGQS